MIILLVLFPQKSKATYFRAFVHWWRSVLPLDSKEDNGFKSSMKAHTKGSGLLLITNIGTFVCKEYSKIIHSYLQEQNNRNCATCKYSTLMSMLTTGSQFWKRFAKNSYIWFNYLYPLVWNSISPEGKKY